MSEFEDKLNSLLSSPESMAQVAELAKKLSGQSSGEPPRQPEAKSENAADQGLASLLGGIDPKALSQLASLFSPPGRDSGAAPPSGGLASLLGGGGADAAAKFLPLLSQLNDGKQEERARLLYALKPFLKAERQDKIDRALQLARLLRAGKLFLKGLGE